MKQNLNTVVNQNESSKKAMEENNENDKMMENKIKELENEVSWERDKNYIKFDAITYKFISFHIKFLKKKILNLIIAQNWKRDSWKRNKIQGPAYWRVAK